MREGGCLDVPELDGLVVGGGHEGQVARPPRHLAHVQRVVLHTPAISKLDGGSEGARERCCILDKEREREREGGRAEKDLF